LDFFWKSRRLILNLAFSGQVIIHKSPHFIDIPKNGEQVQSSGIRKQTAEVSGRETDLRFFQRQEITYLQHRHTTTHRFRKDPYRTYLFLYPSGNHRKIQEDVRLQRLLSYGIRQQRNPDRTISRERIGHKHQRRRAQGLHCEMLGYRREIQDLIRKFAEIARIVRRSD